MTLCDEKQAKSFGLGKNNVCSGYGCCKASIPDGNHEMTILNIMARSFDNHTYVQNFNPCSVAFVVANDAMPTNIADYLSQDVTYFEKLQLPVVYDWSIIGSGYCATAKADKDYICKGNSECLDVNRGYRCQCKPGYEGNPYLNDCQGLSVTLGLILLFLVGCWLYKLVKRRQAIKQKALYFEKNGGLLLQQQQMSLGQGVVERTKIFTIAELQKATDQFSEDRILGLGGHGTVYKGMLGEGKIVAVKKSKRLEESEMREFINEVAILSQINNKNIVKLLGCCLETEVPLLVFEFIPNGTLFHHIHYPSEEFSITWKMRLQIASDSAGALAYLHHLSSIPIFHREIKSSNILLDENFGVVLVELLTGQKAIRAISEQDRSLTSWFLSHMENLRLLDIIDSLVLQENCKEEFHTVANLAKQCLNLDGKRRPSMKEVLLEIEAVLSFHLPQMNEPNSPKPDQVFVTGAIQGSLSDCASSSSTFYLESKSFKFC
uniref:Uncharacterized protein n=1 Tax=Chenopodium quinoa TaxID=63459 RepID=A0A803KMT4_CHEQI